MVYIPSGSDVQVICKKCGKKRASSEFKLDYVLKTVVCSDCYRNNNTPKKEPEIKKDLPPGWDEDDVLLEKLNKEPKPRPDFRKTEDEGILMYTCTKCGYGFKYRKHLKKPSNCPYCDKEVPRI